MVAKMIQIRSHRLVEENIIQNVNVVIYEMNTVLLKHRGRTG